MQTFQLNVYFNDINVTAERNGQVIRSNNAYRVGTGISDTFLICNDLEVFPGNFSIDPWGL
ncbi:hypothetical protein [Marinoscillum furvescens]|uniref:hypothetical protein n=1 Tax=Marinoscillum furvescens TaxID=1026 RepID=UPI0011C07708|nr:hypothetical protein [Marinoscillum furvescens]